MDKYKVLRKIGTGAYGSAYLVCLKEDPQQQYVLKKVQPRDATERQKQQAQNEVELLSKLSHPFVLGYIDHFAYKQQLCIITDYCERGDLYDYLQTNKQQGKIPLPEAQVLDWLVQMLLAIQHVHSHAVLHRDLKTQNIFLTKEGYIKLGDFGIARSLTGPEGMASTLIGTPYYMSPEIMQNLPYDYKSDMWSMGCVLFELLAGHKAFAADDMPGLVAKILKGAHQPIPAHISWELQVLVRRLLSGSPAQRPSCDDILALPFLQPAVAAAQALMADLKASKAESALLAAPAPTLALEAATVTAAAAAAATDQAAVVPDVVTASQTGAAAAKASSRPAPAARDSSATVVRTVTAAANAAAAANANAAATNAAASASGSTAASSYTATAAASAAVAAKKITGRPVSRVPSAAMLSPHQAPAVAAPAVPAAGAAAAAAAATAAPADDTLDAELQAARERLRLIEAQREAVREQVLKCQLDMVGGAGGAAPGSVRLPAFTHFSVSSASSNNNSSSGSNSQPQQVRRSLHSLPVELLAQQQQQQQQQSAAAAAAVSSYPPIAALAHSHSSRSFSGGASNCNSSNGSSSNSTSSNNSGSGSGGARSAFAAAALQRRAVSQSQLAVDNSSAAGGATALAAAAAAAGRTAAGPWVTSSPRVTRSPRVTISPRVSGSQLPWTSGSGQSHEHSPAAAAAAGGASVTAADGVTSSRSGAPALLHQPNVGNAGMEAIEQLLRPSDSQGMGSVPASPTGSNCDRLSGHKLPSKHASFSSAHSVPAAGSLLQQGSAAVPDLGAGCSFDLASAAAAAAAAAVQTPRSSRHSGMLGSNSPALLSAPATACLSARSSRRQLLPGEPDAPGDLMQLRQRSAALLGIDSSMMAADGSFTGYQQQQQQQPQPQQQPSQQQQQAAAAPGSSARQGRRSFVDAEHALSAAERAAAVLLGDFLAPNFQGLILNPSGPNSSSSSNTAMQLQLQPLRSASPVSTVAEPACDSSDAAAVGNKTSSFGGFGTALTHSVPANLQQCGSATDTRTCLFGTYLEASNSCSSNISCGSASSASSSSSSGSAQLEILKARREARRAEELKRKEADLEQARSTYQCERAAAEARASSLFGGSPGGLIMPIIPAAAANPAAAGGDGGQHPALKRSGVSQGALDVAGRAATGSSGSDPGMLQQQWLKLHHPAAVLHAMPQQQQQQQQQQQPHLPCVAGGVASPATSSAGSEGAAGTAKPPLAGRRSSKHQVAGLTASCSGSVQVPMHIAAAAAAGSSGSGSTSLDASPPAAPGPGMLATAWGTAQQQQQQRYAAAVGGADIMQLQQQQQHTCEDLDSDEAELDRQLAALAALRKSSRQAVPVGVGASISAKSIVGMTAALSGGGLPLSGGGSGKGLLLQ